MSRTYAKVWTSIWADDDFRRRTAPEQHLFFTLLTSPSLNHCGIADWRPKRLAKLATGWTIDQVEQAGAGLAAARYVVIDDDSEEVLLRSFIRHDEILKQPNLAVAMLTALTGTASTVLRGVVVHELRRLRDDQPDLAAWHSKGSKDKLEEALARDSVDPATVTPFTVPAALLDTHSTPQANPSRKGSRKGSANPSFDPSVLGSSEPTPNPSADPSAKGLTPAPAPTPASTSHQPSGSYEPDRDSRGRGRPATSKRSDALSGPSGDDEKTAANVLIAGWIDKVGFRPTAQVLGQVAKHVRQLLVEGCPEDVVRDALDEWQMKGQHPSVLPTIAHAIRSRRSGSASQPGAAPVPQVWPFMANTASQGPDAVQDGAA